MRVDKLVSFQQFNNLLNLFGNSLELFENFIIFISFILPLIRTLYCWVLSKEISSAIFKVFGMTRPGIEPWSPGLFANTSQQNRQIFKNNFSFFSKVLGIFFVLKSGHNVSWGSRIHWPSIERNKALSPQWSLAVGGYP